MYNYIIGTYYKQDVPSNSRFNIFIPENNKNSNISRNIFFVNPSCLLLITIP